MGGSFSPMDWALTAATAGLYAPAKIGYDMLIGNPQKQMDMQKSAQEQAKSAALKQESMADQANNKANQKSPDISSILSAAQNAAKTGGASTMLTGPAGIDPKSLQLGKSSLLGA